MHAARFTYSELHTHTHSHAHAHMHMKSHICIHTFLHIHLCTHLYTFTFTYTHTHTHQLSHIKISCTRSLFYTHINADSKTSVGSEVPGQAPMWMLCILHSHVDPWGILHSQQNRARQCLMTLSALGGLRLTFTPRASGPTVFFKTEARAALRSSKSCT